MIIHIQVSRVGVDDIDWRLETAKDAIELAWHLIKELELQ